MVSLVNREFLHLASVAKQTWFIYRMYNKYGQLICFVGEPAGNSRCRICGQTEESLLANIKKYMLNQTVVKQYNG